VKRLVLILSVLMPVPVLADGLPRTPHVIEAPDIVEDVPDRVWRTPNYGERPWPAEVERRGNMFMVSPDQGFQRRPPGERQGVRPPGDFQLPRQR